MCGVHHRSIRVQAGSRADAGCQQERERCVPQKAKEEGQGRARHHRNSSSNNSSQEAAKERPTLRACLFGPFIHLLLVIFSPPN